MHDRTGEPTDRRDFLGTVALSAVALTAAACAPAAGAAAGAAATAPAPAQGQGAAPAPEPPPIVPAQWDNAWFDKLTARHKAVFEQPDLDYGSAVSFAQRWIAGLRDAGIAKAGEFQAVLVLRHDAVPLLVNDAMWEKYGVGRALKYKPEGEAIRTTNPIATARATPGRAPRPDDPMRPQGNIPWFTAHGHITLGCNAAFNAFAWETAQRVKGDRTAIYEEFKANLLPGVILQPNGVYATLRAQQAGCVYIRAS
jgi:hypothetical protein